MSGVVLALASANPYTSPETKPKSKTACGGLLAGIGLPIAIVIYTLWWLSEWYGADNGAIASTVVSALDNSLGIRLDNRQIMREPRSGQIMRCAADSGCWYTVYFKTKEGERDEPDNTCPPKQVIEKTKMKSKQAAALFGTSVAVSAPGLGSTSDGSDASHFNETVQVNKKCVYAAKGEPLIGSCLFYSPDPIETFTVVWRTNEGANANNEGVVLVTEFPYFDETFNQRQERMAARRSSDGGKSWMESMEESTRNWFKFDTFGGGKGFVVQNQAIGMHYGDVALQVIKSYYAHMKDMDGTERTNSTQLVPTYLNTLDVQPEDTNICFQPPSPPAASGRRLQSNFRPASTNARPTTTTPSTTTNRPTITGTTTTRPTTTTPSTTTTTTPSSTTTTRPTTTTTTPSTNTITLTRTSPPPPPKTTDKWSSATNNPTITTTDTTRLSQSTGSNLNTGSASGTNNRVVTSSFETRTDASIGSRDSTQASVTGEDCHTCGTAAARDTSINIDTGILESSDMAGRLQKCTDTAGGTCRQLKLRPGSLQVAETRYTVSPLNTLLGVLGGIFGIFMIVFSTIHALCIAACATKCVLCESADNVKEKRAERRSMRASMAAGGTRTAEVNVTVEADDKKAAASSSGV